MSSGTSGSMRSLQCRREYSERFRRMPRRSWSSGRPTRTSDSNARFDLWLAAQHPDSAIRDFEAVDALAAGAGFRLWHDHTMPANNRLLVWRNGG